MTWRTYTGRKLIRAGLCFAFVPVAHWLPVQAEPSWLAYIPAVALLAGGCVFLWEAFSDAYFRRLFPERQYLVAYDETQITCTKPSGETTVIPWAELQEVIIETTNTGPFVCDYFLHLLASGASCTVPLGAQGYEPLMQRLSQLPDFNHAEAGAATPSTQSAVFRCWRRAAA
jgi:hypothetical protein